MNSSWSRISGSTVLSLSQTLTNDQLSLSQTRAEKSHSPSTQTLFTRELLRKEDIIPSRHKPATPPLRPPSFADETIASKPDNSSELSSLYRRLSEEREQRQRAERQAAHLAAKLSLCSDLESEVQRLKSELKTAREDLDVERGRRKDLSEVRASREVSQKHVFASYEDTIADLKAEVKVKTEEIAHLRSTLRVAAEQRADLLRESELLRQTVAEMKAFNRREAADLKSRLASECALRAATDRKLAESFISAPCDYPLRQQVEKLESKMHNLEVQHRQQTAISQGVKERVQKLTREKMHWKENYEQSPPPTERRKVCSKSPMRSRNE